MSKRVRRPGPKRPVDKAIVVVDKEAVGTTQVNTALRNSVVAETLIRIVGSVCLNGGAGTPAKISLAIIHDPDGQAINTMGQTDGGKFFQPEKNVLWHKSLIGIFSDEIIDLDIDVKGMRKLMDDDIIQFLALSDVVDGFDIHGSLTMFFKQ